ncbi:hypothetical protein GCWU000324_01569 [Kingella oralis ATCC 51147]|uniref:Uncharacterized protein n=1 Tax=Kingella oralis ATCC 51147 TaxID=629741 RepID=C4GKR2_9NEIS|nr:hypothetical protein GCWU000324_01569 [Kingella oralis ATCC 51147]
MMMAMWRGVWLCSGMVWVLLMWLMLMWLMGLPCGWDGNGVDYRGWLSRLYEDCVKDLWAGI